MESGNEFQSTFENQVDNGAPIVPDIDQHMSIGRVN